MNTTFPNTRILLKGNGIRLENDGAERRRTVALFLWKDRELTPHCRTLQSRLLACSRAASAENAIELVARPLPGDPLAVCDSGRRDTAFGVRIFASAKVCTLRRRLHSLVCSKFALRPHLPRIHRAKELADRKAFLRFLLACSVKYRDADYLVSGQVSARLPK